MSQVAYYSQGEGRKFWDPTYPGFDPKLGQTLANVPGMTSGEVAKAAQQYGIGSPQFQQALQVADEKATHSPLGSALSGSAKLIVGGGSTLIGAGKLAGLDKAPNLGPDTMPYKGPDGFNLPQAPGGPALSLPGIGAGSGVGVGGLPQAPGGNGVLDTIQKYLPYAAGAYTAINGAQQSGQSNALLQQALDLSKQRYADTAPLRQVATERLSAPLPTAPDLSYLTDTHNPFARHALPQAPGTPIQPAQLPPMKTMAGRLNDAFGRKVA